MLRAMPEYTIEITGMAYRGRGVGRRDGKVVFVSGVIPGECVRVRTVRSCKSYDEADLVAVERSAPSRRVPECPYVGSCQGCCYQHLDYAEEMRLKDSQLQDFLRRIPEVPPEARQAPVPSPEPLYYRNKIVLHTVGTKDGLRLGYVGADNRTVVPIDCCALALPEINAALARWPEFSASFKPGDRITFRHTPDRGVLWWNAKHPPEEMLTEYILPGAVQLPAAGFFQVNRPVADLLMREVIQLVRSLRIDSMLDLFCGSGMFALAAADAGVERVAGVDVDGAAIRLAGRNAAALNVPFIRFSAVPVERMLRGLPSSPPGENNLWLVDPPRQGLDARTLEGLLKHHPAHLLYISCAPDTLARDLAKLCASVYRVERVRLFDMFPRTYGFESLVLLSARHSR